MKKYLLALVVITSIIIGMMALYTPRVKDDLDEFSANRAFEHILEIAKEPHTVEHTDALADVRNYLIGELDALDMNPVVNNYPQEDTEYGFEMSEVNNILAQIDGQNDTYILLMAHYDSSPAKRIGEEDGSLGAADDGYGLSSILESIRTLKENNIEMKNGIKVLFTDGEELGLYGATNEVENNSEWFDDIGIVINVEARGVKGPNVMFQTSLENYKIIKFFANAKYPVSFSLAGDVYSRMHNSTDLTPMLDNDMYGINMSVLDNLDYYHTSNDNPDNINLSSLQQYGENLVPIIEEFVSNDIYSDIDYFEDDANAMYFTFLPNVFIVYHETTQIVLSIITLMSFACVVYIAVRKEETKLKCIMFNALKWLGMSLGLLVIGFIVSFILSKIFGVPLNPMYMPKITGALFIFIIFVILGALGVIWLFRKNDGNNLYYGGLTLTGILNVIFLLVLPGGAYLFMVPLLVISLVELLRRYLEYKEIEFEHISLINVLISIMIILPVIYLLYIALTIGALGVCMLFLGFLLMLTVPTGLRYLKR